MKIKPFINESSVGVFFYNDDNDKSEGCISICKDSFLKKSLDEFLSDNCSLYEWMDDEKEILKMKKVISESFFIMHKEIENFNK